MGAFYALVLPVLGDGWTSSLRLSMGVLYFLLHMWAARAAYAVTAADPADTLLMVSEKYREKVRNGAQGQMGCAYLFCCRVPLRWPSANLCVVSQVGSDVERLHPPLHETCYFPAAKVRACQRNILKKPS